VRQEQLHYFVSLVRNYIFTRVTRPFCASIVMYARISKVSQLLYIITTLEIQTVWHTQRTSGHYVA